MTYLQPNVGANADPRLPGDSKADPQLPGGTNGLGDIPLGDDGAPGDTLLGDIPLGDDGAPVFAAPWEASAFALAVRLSGEGHFTWSEWAAALSEEIRAAQREGDPDRGDTYYKHWLRALERLCSERGLVSQEEASGRKEAWRRAYLDTPHGMPVELAPRHNHNTP